MSTPATKSKQVKATLSNATSLTIVSATMSNEFCVLSTKVNKSNMFNFRRQCRTIEEQVAVEVQVWTTFLTVEGCWRLCMQRLFLICQSGKATIALLVLQKYGEEHGSRWGWSVEKNWAMHILRNLLICSTQYNALGKQHWQKPVIGTPDCASCVMWQYSEYLWDSRPTAASTSRMIQVGKKATMKKYQCCF